MSNVDYGEDFLQRIIAVHWRTPGLVEGGVFIAGDGDGNIFNLRVGPGAELDEHTGLPAWKNLGTLGVGLSWVQGSSHAVVDRGANKEPVFVLVGGTGGTGGVGVIMASADGLSWSRVYTQTVAGGPVSTDRGQGANVWAVVWDEKDKNFYAAGHQSFDREVDPGDPHLYECDILLKSSDGHSWSEVGRVNNAWDSSVIGTTWAPYPTGLLDAHCNKRATDDLGNGLPDGFYKYDSTNNIMIVPTKVVDLDYLFGGIGVNYIPPSSVTVTKFAVDPRPLPPSSTGIPTYCVAGIGESWMAAGGTFGTGGGPGTCQASYQAPSVEEGGIRWLSLNPPGNQPIITMTGGQAKPPPA